MAKVLIATVKPFSAEAVEEVADFSGEKVAVLEFAKKLNLGLFR